MSGGTQKGDEGTRAEADGRPEETGPPVLRSVCGHKASYEDPLAGSAGDELEVGPADVEWPAWRWCTAADGRRGWVPESLLEGDGPRRTLTRDYDARELTVRAGERIEVLETESGWARCRTDDGREGWLPGGCVKPPAKS